MDGWVAIIVTIAAAVVSGLSGGLATHYIGKRKREKEKAEQEAKEIKKELKEALLNNKKMLKSNIDEIFATLDTMHLEARSGVIQSSKVRLHSKTLRNDYVNYNMPRNVIDAIRHEIKTKLISKEITNDILIFNSNQLDNFSTKPDWENIPELIEVRESTNEKKIKRILNEVLPPLISKTCRDELIAIEKAIRFEKNKTKKSELEIELRKKLNSIIKRAKDNIKELQDLTISWKQA